MDDGLISGREPGPDTVSIWVDGVTCETTLSVRNLSNTTVDALWLDYEGNRQKFAQLRPGAVWNQSTYNTHPWLLKSKSGTALAVYCGGTAALVIQPDTTVTFSSGDPEDEVYHHPEWGVYAQRDAVQGISVWAYDCVSTAAVQQALHILAKMLQHTPPAILERLQQGRARVAIIGRRQVTTDIPEHSFMKCSGEDGERDVDTTARGLGGTKAVPTCSCGEENLLRDGDKGYTKENILIHEFGHSVMEIGLTTDEHEAIEVLYEAARSSGTYDLDCYMMENAAEYWAEACQSWFEASLRQDVNSGVNTRSKLRRHDPELANMLCSVFGDGLWRYWHDCPGEWDNKEARLLDLAGNPRIPSTSPNITHNPSEAPITSTGASDVVPLHFGDMDRSASGKEPSTRYSASRGCLHVLTACFTFGWFRQTYEQKRSL